MQKPLILITGATGKMGAAVVAELRAQDWPVRAIVRARDGRSENLDRLGAETVVADLFDPDQLLGAMRGVARAYYCQTWDPYMLQSAAAFAVAAGEARLESIVGLTQWLASPAHPSLATRQSWFADQLFAMLPGVAHTIVNPGYFADNYLRLTSFAAHLGVLPSVTGDSRNAPPSNEDIARVAVAALIDPARHAGKSYRPTGPALLSTDDMAAILSRVLRRKVRRLEMPLWLFLKAARLQDSSAFLLSGLRYYVEDHKQGAFAFAAPNDDVREATGGPAEDFETTARRYAAAPEVQRTFGNGLRAFAQFMRIPFSHGYDLDRYDRGLGFPAPPEPRLAMADERWKAARQRAAAAGAAPIPPLLAPLIYPQVEWRLSQ
jgi:uncharacterized protein YbjT (DUF2867 family)